MPANFENGVFAGNMPAWHGCGVVVPDTALTAEAVFAHVPELAMRVEGYRLYAIGPDGKPIAIEDSVANFRSDGSYLGIVGSGYVPVQSADAFAFMTELLQSGEAIVHTAGTLSRGRRAWVQCIAPEPFRIGGEPTEEHHGFVTFLNSFDGTLPVGAVTGATRVVCENTYRAAMDGAKNEYWFKHTTGIMDRVGEARQALRIGADYWREVQRIGDIAIMSKFSDRQFAAVLDTVVPIVKADGTEITGRKRTNADKERETINRLWKNSATIRNVAHTAWAAVNVFTEYTGHHIESRETTRNSWADNRLNRIWLGKSAADVAIPVIYEMAGVK